MKNWDSNPLKFNDITLRRYPNRPLTKDIIHNVNALDTETLKGYVKIIADQTGQCIEPHSIDDLLEFMTQSKYRSAHNFFYNIRFDYQAILKWFDEDLIKEIYANGKIEYKDYKIKYIPKRLFSITKNKHVHKYYDLAQFYEMSLEKAAKKYTNKSKNEDNLDRNLIGTSATYWRLHKEEIIKYCIQDCQITYDLGVLLRDTLQEKVKFPAQNFISKAGLSKEYFRTFCDIPAIDNIPKGALSMFMQAYSAGRFEVIRKGFIPGCYAIDLNSAYSKAISELPDITRGQWKKTVKVHEDAILGVYLVKMSGLHTMVAPHRYRLKNGLIVYPTGTYYTYMTKIEYVEYKHDTNIKVYRGWEFFSRDIHKPFKKRIRALYRLKSQTSKLEYEYDLYKKIMNSLYGSFYEKREEDGKWYAGKLFNPIYATLICAWCRVEMWKVMREYPENVISAATDGLILDTKPNIHLSKKMGDWSEEGKGDVIMLRSGLYRIGEKVRERGIMSFKGIKTKYGVYEDIFEYIEDKPERKCYPILSHRPLNMGECIIHHKKKNLDMMNIFVDQEYTITINKDYKRLWNDTFMNGGELFEKEISSRPLIIN